MPATSPPVPRRRHASLSLLRRAVAACAVAAVACVLVACTRTCVGAPELGSKQRPVRFFLDGWARDRESLGMFSLLSACLERQSGYRVSFEIAANERAVASALGRGEVQAGTMSAFGFVEASQGQGLVPLLVVSQRGAPSTRSALIGKASRWAPSLQNLGLTLSAQGLRTEEALQPITGRRFAYTAPDSDLGFFVPRYLLLQRNVFPDEVLFAGSNELVLQAVERDLAMAGAVAETFLEKGWPERVPFQVGTAFDDFVVLALSRGLPGRVLVVRREMPTRIQEALASGLQACAAQGASAEVAAVFDGDGFQRSNDRLFEFVRDLHGFQQDHVRVLTLQDDDATGGETGTEGDGDPVPEDAKGTTESKPTKATRGTERAKGTGDTLRIPAPATPSPEGARPDILPPPVPAPPPASPSIPAAEGNHSSK